MAVKGSDGIWYSPEGEKWNNYDGVEIALAVGEMKQRMNMAEQEYRKAFFSRLGDSKRLISMSGDSPAFKEMLEKTANGSGADAYNMVTVNGTRAVYYKGGLAGFFNKETGRWYDGEGNDLGTKDHTWIMQELMERELLEKQIDMVLEYGSYAIGGYGLALWALRLSRAVAVHGAKQVLGHPELRKLYLQANKEMGGGRKWFREERKKALDEKWLESKEYGVFGAGAIVDIISSVRKKDAKKVIPSLISAAGFIKIPLTKWGAPPTAFVWSLVDPLGEDKE